MEFHTIRSRRPVGPPKHHSTADLLFLCFQSLPTVKFSNHCVLKTIRIGPGVYPSPSSRRVPSRILLQSSLQKLPFVFNELQVAPPATPFFSSFCIVARGWVRPTFQLFNVQTFTSRARNHRVTDTVHSGRGGGTCLPPVTSHESPVTSFRLSVVGTVGVLSRRCGDREASEGRQDSAWCRQRSNWARRTLRNCSDQAHRPEERASRQQEAGVSG
jgi:hypothetical protein